MRKTLLAIAIAGLSVVAVSAQAEPPIISQQSITLGGEALGYTTEAGYIPAANAVSKEAHANYFYTAYIARGGDANRPVAFLWNGGPGAPSSWVQFKGFGPRVIDGDHLADNPDTLLPAADLVFIDPIGTGFSRPLKTEYGKEYYNTLGDAAAATDMIRTWLREHHAAGRPVFLVGESFGGYRAGGVAERLESGGQHLTGVVLVSGGVASGPLIPPVVRAALATPQKTASALVLGKLAADLGTDRATVVRAATRWSLETYLPALVHADKLSDAERTAIVNDLSRYTGYPADRIDRKTLMINGQDYLKVMSPDPKTPLSVYDMRTTASSDLDGALIHRFYADIGLRDQPAYWDIGTTMDPGQAREGGWVWNYRWPESEKWGSDYAEPWLPYAMKVNPHLKVMVAAGQYDAANSCAENDVLLSMLDTELARNYSMYCYLGGHMIYRSPDARHVLNTDIRDFIRHSAAQR
ncbi:MAG TPA: alpha/beta hydrolase [Caulobacteraceae bacterium]|jgi:carboxypeptidase C (cathepsin A)|nr:alpha/beta hydrolase [Caulobacteraceae bacterium]